MAGQTMVRLRFDVAGDVQLSRGFLAYADEVADMTEPLARMGEHIRAAVGEQFATEGGRAGGWVQLSPGYAAWKDEHFPGRPIGVLTGGMRSAALSPDAVTVTPQLLRYEIDGKNADRALNSPGDAGERAVWFQTGEGRMPIREIVRLLATDKRQLERYFAEWLNSLRRGLIGGPR
jgi:hypothetical protein